MNINKINGFTRTLHPYQITSYIYFLGLFLVYFFTIFPLSSQTTRIVGAILVIINGAVVVISGYIVTKTDPSDSYILAAKQAVGKKEKYEPPESEYYCTYDKAHVHESSKHCRRCDRCTEGFDHHCKWVNNDIGKKNYKSFVTLIASTMTFLLIFLVFGALVTADFARDVLLDKSDIYLYGDTRGKVLIGLIIMWVFMGISIVFGCLVANLVFFHIFLIKKGLTTFQYITFIEERKEYKREMEYARKILGGKENKTRLDFVLCLDRKKKKRQLKKTPDQQAEAKVDSDRQEGDLEAHKKLSVGSSRGTENDDLIEALTQGGNAKSMNECGSKGSLDNANDESRKVEVLEKDKQEKREDKRLSYTITIKDQEVEAGNSECMEAFIPKEYTLKVQGPSLPTLDTLERESDIEGFVNKRISTSQMEVRKHANEKYMRDLLRSRKRNNNKGLALEIIDSRDLGSQRKQQNSCENGRHKSFTYYPDKENPAGNKVVSQNVSRNFTSPNMIHNKISSSPMVYETNSATANLESKEVTIMRLDEMKIEEDSSSMNSSQESQLTGEAFDSKKGKSEESFKGLEVENLG